MNNRILDYNQVLQKLRKLERNSDVIKSAEHLGRTTLNLPILHYTVGSGKNHIVLSASQHGCEIITTDFLLALMDKISNKDKRFEFLNNGHYTLHFLPMLNPEGYIISTSAVRTVIKRNTSDFEAQSLYHEYLEAYRRDDLDCKLKLNTKEKYHQKFFGHIDPYLLMQNNFKKAHKIIAKIYDNKELSRGTLAVWHSNANGVDLNQNMPYNYKIQAIQEGKKLYSLFRYDNIETTRPGPIGCPMRGKEFQYEPENVALLNFLYDLKYNKNIELCAFMNYHSTGGLVYYRPYNNLQEVHPNHVLKNMDIEEVYNKKIAEIYSKNTDYRLMEGESGFNCFNDLLRLHIPGNILIELSKFTGNPIGPYVRENYKKVIEDNINATAITLEKIPELNRIKKEFIKSKEKKREVLER